MLLKHESQLLNGHKMNKSLVAVDLNHLDLRDHNSKKEYLVIGSFPSVILVTKIKVLTKLLSYSTTRNHLFSRQFLL